MSDDSTGLWGFSYGGLFAAYAAFSTDHFTFVGAGSPADMPQVLVLCENAAVEPTLPTVRHLHVTIGQRELDDPALAEALGASDLIEQLDRRPVKGRTVTKEVIPLESHGTGVAPSWFSFLRACYSSLPTAPSVDH